MQIIQALNIHKNVFFIVAEDAAEEIFASFFVLVDLVYDRAELVVRYWSFACHYLFDYGAHFFVDFEKLIGVVVFFLVDVADVDVADEVVFLRFVFRNGLDLSEVGSVGKK